MKKPEQKLWEGLNRAMSMQWAASRVENRLNKSMPDVAYSVQKKHGWLELKSIESWPTNWLHTPAALGSNYFTRGQRRWLERHGGMGHGGCFIAVWVRSNNLVYFYDHTQVWNIGENSVNWHIQKARVVLDLAHISQEDQAALVDLLAG